MTNFRTQEQRGSPTSRLWDPRRLWSYLSFSWAAPAIAQANKEGELNPADAWAVLPPKDETEPLSAEFEGVYAAVKVR
jgi:hypothetical protein